ncbi:MAG: efflux RND transporter periplasmic adaptor subunit [Armatimonadetes bacterium]|nr:efflux RND transporter periplasmic adaptor subunit [Armatimonadota bacterium]
MNKKKTIRPLSIVIILIILGVIIYLAIPRPTLVDAVRVRRGDLMAELSTTGVVESEMSDIAPKIIARVSELLVQEDQLVRRGQVLAVLDRSELEAQVREARSALSAALEDLSRSEKAVHLQLQQSSASIARAKAALHAAEAQLADIAKGPRPQEIEQAQNNVNQTRAEAERAKADLERAEKLVKRGAIAPQQLDAAQTAAKVANARLAAAEAQLELLKQGSRPDEVRAARAQVSAARAGLLEAKASAETVAIRKSEAAIVRSNVERAKAALQAAQAQLGYAVIRCPFDGIVARKHLEKGEIAGPQIPIYTIADIRKIWVTAEVDEEDMASIALGQRVVISTDAFPGKVARGTVVRISPIAEPKAVGRVRAKIVRAKIIVNYSEFLLKPGMEVDISGSVLIGRNQLLVPNDALLQVGKEYQVFVIKGGRAYPKTVTPGLSNYEYTAISRGLRPGELVIVSRPEQLKPGWLVRVRRQTSATR